MTTTVTPPVAAGAPPAGTSRRWRFDPMPPLPWKSHLWRIVVAGLLGLGSVLLTFADLPPAHVDDRIGFLIFLDVLVVGPVALGLLVLHRAFPLTIAVLTTLLASVSAVAGIASLVCLVSVSTRRRMREIVPIAVLGMLTAPVYEVLYPHSSSGDWLLLAPLVLAVTVGAVAFGMFLGARRELVDSWRLRAMAADREQALAAERAREAERARIAREMHDVLAHRLSLVSMHAGVLAFRADLAPEQVREEAAVIQDAARQALDELRGVLGLLRDSDTGRPPQPTIDDLEGLVEQARTAGPVDLETSLAAAPPVPLGRHAYRAVQEGLTNARKHAPGAPVTVRVTGAPGGALEVEVRNARPSAVPGGGAGGTVGGAGGVATPSPARGTGLGLVGLTERAALVGGTVTAGPAPDGGFVLAVRLPWAATGGDGRG